MQREIPYNPENEEHIRIVKGAKFSSLPVVFPNGVEDVEGAFSGFAPKKVAELKARFK